MHQKKCTDCSQLTEYKSVAVQPKYKPTMTTKHLNRTDTDDIANACLVVGDKIKEKGADLPSGKNLADYFDGQMRFDYVKFWLDHKKPFPKMWSHAVERASCNPTEVSCETLFSESGYASTSRRTRLKSRQFEREIIIAHSLKHVFFNLERAVDIYMEREKNKDWNDDEHRDDLWYMEQEPELFVSRGGGSTEEDNDDESTSNGSVDDAVEIIGTSDKESDDGEKKMAAA
jgi:hypothetical protein